MYSNRIRTEIGLRIPYSALQQGRLTHLSAPSARFETDCPR